MGSVHQSEHLLFTILLQLIVMIGVARIMNTVFRKFRQPGVIGEIVAGLMLGPSLLGHFFPLQSHALFGVTASPAVAPAFRICGGWPLATVTPARMVPLPEVT